MHNFFQSSGYGSARNVDRWSQQGESVGLVNCMQVGFTNQSAEFFEDEFGCGDFRFQNS